MTKNFKFLLAHRQRYFLTAIILIAILLRFYKLGTNPPGLYWDEAVFGYDAYSILKTAHDHHGQFLPLFFESFGDWKLPVYHYLLVPSIAIFGLNEFAVRFPSALLGTFTVIAFYFLVKKVTQNPTLSLFCTLFLAISPWHIQFSRGGFESTVGLFFVVSGLYLFLRSLTRSKPINRLIDRLDLTAAFCLFVLSMYSYHAYRIFTPLQVVALVLLFLSRIKDKTKLFPPLLISGVLLIPLILFTFSPQGRARAISQSAFKPSEVESARIDYDQKSKKPLRFLSKYLYPEPVYYANLTAKGYMDHFSPVFLFTKGDQIGRHSQVDMGQIHIFEAILAITALFSLKTLNQDTKKLFLTMLILAPLAATIVLPTPHAYRTLQMSVPLAFFSGLGAYILFTRVRSNLLKIVIVSASIYFFISYLHLLFVHYPAKFGRDWQEGYRQLVAKIEKYQQDFEKVYVTNIDQVPYIYLLFYQKYDPQKYIDTGGTKLAFDKYVFISPEENKYDKGRILYAAPSWEKVDGIWLAAVDDAGGRHLFSLWEINGQK